MGVAILRSIAVVFPGVADFICHFHFLRDIGKDVLLQDHQTIMKRLKVFDVRGSLRRKANYLEGKIGNDTETIIKFGKAIEDGTFTSNYLQSIPEVATYCLINLRVHSSLDLKKEISHNVPITEYVLKIVH